MKSSVYSRWDGTQDEFTLDAERALDALTDLMMQGLDAREAMEYMRQHGFELAGTRLPRDGPAELLEELRKQIRAARGALSTSTTRPTSCASASRQRSIARATPCASATASSRAR